MFMDLNPGASDQLSRLFSGCLMRMRIFQKHYRLHTMLLQQLRNVFHGSASDDNRVDIGPVRFTARADDISVQDIGQRLHFLQGFLTHLDLPPV